MKPNNKKRIVIDARFFGPSHTGLGRYTQSLITALYKQSKKYEFVLLANSSQKQSLKKLFPRFKIHCTQVKHYSLAEQLVIPGILKRLKPDLVHFMHFNVPFFYSKPFIVTIHDLIKHHSKGQATTTHYPIIYPFKRLGYHLTISHAIKKSLLICTPSEWVKKDILNHYSVKPSKIIVTEEAADQIFFKPVKGRIKDLIPPSPYLIFTGNAYPHKNIVQLIKALKKYREKYKSQLQLVLITAKDAFYQRLRLQLKQLDAQDCVKIKGYCTDEQMHNLYHYALAFITPSLQEGFGLPGLEAMASSTLVLSSNRTCLPQVYGQAALYFNPDNLDDLVKTIAKAVKMSTKQRNKQISLGRAQALSYSWEQTALKTLKAYENCFYL